MQIVLSEEIKEAFERVCAYAHKYRVDVTITFGADGDAELKAEPTYWDRDTADTPQTDYPCNTCANKGDHDGECQNCVVDSAPIRWETPSHYKPKQTDCPKSCPPINICTKDDTDCPWK